MPIHVVLVTEVPEVTVYVIIHSPECYNGKYCVREWHGLDPAPGWMAMAETLEEARAALPEGCEPMEVQPNVPLIVEIWKAKS